MIPIQSDQPSAWETLEIMVISFSAIFVAGFLVTAHQLWRMGNNLADLVSIFQQRGKINWPTEDKDDAAKAAKSNRHTE